MKNYLIFALAFLFLITGCNRKQNIYKDFIKETENTTESSKKMTVTETPLITQIEETASDPEVCIEMNEILKKSGYTLKDINNANQLITVDSNECQCKVTAFELIDNEWLECYSTSGIVGKDGVSENSSENNSCTPFGIFDIGFAFGTQPLEGLSIEYRQINENCYWVDDPESELYNQWVESDAINWNSAEHLIEYPESYKYAVSINYNMNPVIPYAGSAIFLHCDDGNYGYTAGCIAVSENDMLDIIKWLDKNKYPKILII